MKTIIKKLPKSQVELKIELSSEELEKFIEKAVLELGKDLELPGFRKGQVPKEIIEKEIPQEKILAKAAELAIKESYAQAILENNIEAISQPEIEILKLARGNPLEFQVKVSVLPKINLPDYKEIASKVKKNKISVPKEEVQNTLLWLQKSRAKFIIKNQPAEEGDWVEITFSSPQIEEGKERKDNFILGRGHFLPGFEENLKGMKDGQEKEFKVKFPSDFYNKNLADQEVNFKVKMDSVKIMELPEMTDEWAKSLGNFENLENLKNSIKEGLIKEKEMEEKNRVRQEILEKITENTQMEIPEVLIELEKKEMLENLKKNVNQALQMNFENYLKEINKTEETILKEFTPRAEKNVKQFLILREIAKRENIEPTPEELEEELQKILKRFPDPQTAQQYLDPKELKEYTKNIITTEKTLESLESYSGK